MADFLVQQTSHCSWLSSTLTKMAESLLIKHTGVDCLLLGNDSDHVVSLRFRYRCLATGSHSQFKFGNSRLRRLGIQWLATRPFVFNWSQKIAEILLKVLKSIVNRFSSANHLKTARMIGKRRWIYKTIRPCSAERSSSSSTHMIYDWGELVDTLTSFFGVQ